MNFTKIGWNMCIHETITVQNYKLTTKENMYSLLGFEPLSAGTKNQCDTNEQRWLLFEKKTCIIF